MDARVKHSQKMIGLAFVSLLKEKPIDKVTVTDICNRAGVNRATFYKYYESPESLLDKMEDQAMASLKAKIDAAEINTLDELVALVVSEMRQEAEFYLMVFDGVGNPDFRKKFIDTLYEPNMRFLRERFPWISDQQKDWLYYFIMSGCMGVFTVWLAKGAVEPIETITGFTLNFVGKIYEHGKDYKLDL